MCGRKIWVAVWVEIFSQRSVSPKTQENPSNLKQELDLLSEILSSTLANVTFHL